MTDFLSKRVSRRGVLGVAAVAGVSVMMPTQRFLSTLLSGNPSSPPVKLFEATLPRPPVLKPVRSDATTDFYEITSMEVQQPILPGAPTTIWGYNGLYPGPTIEAHEGRHVVVKHTNGVALGNSVHLHGAVVNGDSDGHPLLIFEPGTSRTYTYPNPVLTFPQAPDIHFQSARTQWYHDHVADHTAETVYRGLAGFYLIRDDQEATFKLPSGQFEIPLVLQDRIFNSDNSLLFPAFPTLGTENDFLGDTILVNGKPWPRLSVQRRKYRFRVLNGSLARQYDLALSTGEPLIQIASEGGFLDRPRYLAHLFIAQAERYEFILDFTNSPSQVVLQNLNDQGNLGNVMLFDVQPQRVADDSQIPTSMRAFSPIPESEATVTRHFRFERQNGMWSINGLLFDETGTRVDADPMPHTTEIWELVNKSGGWTHPIHIHLINFNILDRNGTTPMIWEANCWKEAVILNHNTTVRVIMRWPDVPAGPPGIAPTFFTRRYVFHCHNLEHEDHSMMDEIMVQPV
jgi:FtsP/CotA-like multicopper oxidase with cupredoxin domain